MEYSIIFNKEHNMMKYSYYNILFDTDNKNKKYFYMSNF